MLSLGKLLVETPKHLDDTKSSRSDRVTEITSRGRDGADNA